ncbi:hypothetical protein ACQCSX_19285 [Pseudarthrobacter sp. P1]|uniref:hypothetical protein n=1 Tax=Pseudarthrobacter sp. P1 TaxID=3418418 RepID=UPI003CEC1430
MAVQAMGPSYAGGTQPVVKGGYSVLYLPDVNNRELIAQGEAPVFYYIPNIVRMARKNGPDAGDYLFNLIRFAGTGGAGVIGGGGDVAGGVVTFSVTGALPDSVRTQSESEITARFKDSEDVFWGIKNSRKPPMFRPAIITSSTTSVSNIAPTTRGFPVLGTATRDGKTVSEYQYFGMPGSRAGARPMPGEARDGEAPPAGPVTQPDGAPPVLTNGSGNNLDPFYWQMYGEGAGSIDPTGTHAYSGLVGKYPAAILWEAFHGTASPLIVVQNYKLKVWSPVCTLSITGNWDKVFSHFSAAASGRYLWASADLKTEFNNMRTNGTVVVDLKVDTTLPGADAIAKRLDEKSNLVYEKFMEQAKKMIFDPPQPQVEAAQASSSGGSIFSPWGAGLALKYRRDTTNLTLNYTETQQFAYLQDHTISSSLAGMYDEMKADPDAERKYFLTVYLDDWPRRLARVCHPVASWGDGTVAQLAIQVGYPNTKGEINWEGTSFSGPGGADSSWKYQTAQKIASDVQNAPAGWKPDLTFVKRQVFLNEPPSELADQYKRVQIQKNVITIDPEPNGTLINDTTLEVRADSAGRLAVGPIELGVVLTDDTQLVEAEFEAVDPDSGDSVGIDSVRFRWSRADYGEDRTWTIFTGDPGFRPFYRYRVSVTVKGTLFEPGRAWSGPWTRSSGNGPLLIDVPRPDSPGVVTRAVPDDRIRLLRELVTREAAAAAGGGGDGAKPAGGAKSGPPAPEGLDAPERPDANAPRTYLDYKL